MSPLANCAVLAAIPLTLLLAGYGVAARLPQLSAVHRLSVAALAGLAVLLWNVTVVGLFRPLGAIESWLCLWPVAVTLLHPGTRRVCAGDVRAWFRHPLGQWAAGLTAAVALVLLAPLLVRPGLVFYDGTSNHDSFFWISAAEHLQHHTYLEAPAVNLARPYQNVTSSIIGWKADWGRMGAEGLLAMTASIARAEPMAVYLAATLGLIVPWLAGLFLALRTFLLGPLTRRTVLVLVLLQPIFVFFYANANLPNLVGALMAAAIIVGLQRAITAEADRPAWLAVLALGLHGLLCGYPEMLPFVALPCGLLLVRAAWQQGWTPVVRRWIAHVAIAVTIGCVLNPASSVRAAHGFVISFGAARADHNWANLFEHLTAVQYPAGLATLAVWAVYRLGPLLSGLLVIPLVAGLVLALRRAHDRAGAMITLAGSGALLAYTLATGFNYGWQKLVQFGGVFWPALLPVAIVAAYLDAAPQRRSGRWACHAGLIGVLLLFGSAMVVNVEELFTWSEHKKITRDWFALRAFARERLPDRSIRVEPTTFSMAHYYSMWAAYFLRDNDLYFAARGSKNAGYLVNHVLREDRVPVPADALWLVGRAWADAFDRDRERVYEGDTFVLATSTHRVLAWEGLEPENGPPVTAHGRVHVGLQPRSAGTFRLTLAPRRRHPATVDAWDVVRRAPGEPDYRARVTGPAPWHFAIPLVADKLNEFELIATPLPQPQRLVPFEVRAASFEPAAP